MKEFSRDGDDTALEGSRSGFTEKSQFRMRELLHHYFGILWHTMEMERPIQLSVPDKFLGRIGAFNSSCCRIL